MTTADRDSAVRLLREIAGRLADAPRKTEENAVAYAERQRASTDARYPYQVGALESSIRHEVNAINSVIDNLLMPKSKESRRGKR